MVEAEWDQLFALIARVVADRAPWPDKAAAVRVEAERRHCAVSLQEFAYWFAPPPVDDAAPPPEGGAGC